MTSEVKIKTYSLVIEIPGLPPTYNAINRLHFAKKNKIKDQWVNAVMLSTTGKKPEKPLSNCYLVLVRFSCSMPDYDGLVSGFKHPIDGLVRAGVLVDDNYAITGQWDCRWKKVSSRKDERIRLEVYGSL